MSTDQNGYQLEQLSPDQRARCAALHEARAVIVERAVLSSGSANPVDLITVAQWILDGKNPWSNDAESEVDAKSNPDGDPPTGKRTGDIHSGNVYYMPYGTWH